MLVMGFELQFEGVVEVEFFFQVFVLLVVDLCYQCLVDGCGFFFGVGVVELDEGGVGIVIDYCIVFGFDQFVGMVYDLMFVQGDG